tara:strand:- start:564 stop:710 length:147 start_codon:yes stop_codon:yes gene_type:complete
MKGLLFLILSSKKILFFLGIALLITLFVLVPVQLDVWFQGKEATPFPK